MNAAAISARNQESHQDQQETGHPPASPEEVTPQVSTVTAPASAREAMAMVRAGLGYLAAADPTAMAAAEQARCLRGLEQAHSILVAARTSALAGFAAGQGYAADGAYSPRAWLIHHTGITRGAAAGHTAWVRRAAGHPQVAAALAAGEISESFARTICAWTDRLPEDCRPAADDILVTAALSGLGLADLAELAGEIYARAPAARDSHDGDSSDADGDGGKDAAFEDRAVRLETTFQGAGVLTGDLTPQCAEVVRAVLDALSAPADAEDTRSQAQRYHDGLQEAMTSTTDCVLLCAYHHQVMIHRQGWTLVLNPDGTTTAWNKERTTVLHSHGPPARAG